MTWKSETVRREMEIQRNTLDSLQIAASILLKIEDTGNVSMVAVFWGLISRYSKTCHVDQEMDLAFHEICEKIADRIQSTWPNLSSLLYHKAGNSSNVLKKLKQLQKRISSQIPDEDFQIQIERVETGWIKVQKTMIDDLAKTNKLSSRALNHVTELIIRILHLLDQSFNRVLRKLGHSGNLYFPMKGTKKALMYEFRRQKRWGVQFAWDSEAKKELLAIFYQQLFEAGFIDSANRVNAIKPFPDSDSLLLKKVAENCKNCDSITSFKTQLRKILFGHLEKGLTATDVIEPKEIDNKKNTAKFVNLIVLQNSFSDEPPDNWPVELHMYWEYVYKYCIRLKKAAPAFDIKCPKSWKMILEEQPFAYYEEDKLEQSWLDVIYCVANESKHVRLTPSFAAREIHRRKGLLDFCKVHIQIEYAEPLPQLYDWTLYQMIRSSSPSVTVSDAKNLSNLITRFLKNSDLFSHEHDSNGDFWKPVQVISRNLLEEKIDNFSQSSRSKDLLMKQFEVIWKFVETRQKRFYGSEIAPDYSVDLHQLMINAISKMKSIVSTFAEKTNSNGRPSSNNISNALKTLSSASYSDHDILLRIEEVKKSTFRDPQSIVEYHKLLKIASSSKSVAPSQIGKLWMDAVDFLVKKNDPETQWLANRWRAKAVRFLSAPCKSIVSNKELQCLKKLVQEKTKFPPKPSNWDEDLYLQLQHIKEQLNKIRSWSLDLNVGSVRKTSCVAVELVIKLRQLLDQALARFIHRCIALPSAKYCLQAKFPLAGKERLLDELKNKGCGEIIQKGNKYHDVYVLIKKCQPYWYAEQKPSKLEESWLEEIIQISNDAKHIKHPMATQEMVKESLNHATSVDNLLPFPFSESQFYGWSFFYECNNSLEKSKNLYQELKNKKWIDDGGRVNKDTLVKIKDSDALFKKLKEMGSFSRDEEAKKVMKRIQLLLLPAEHRQHYRTISICSLLHRAISQVEDILNVLADHIAKVNSR